MAISINPVLPVLSAQEAGGIAPELVLQPGSVVNAQVLKVLSADLVRIAIASLSIDVASEIPLQQGQNLQLAVVQTRDGIRLAMVGQGGDAGGASADAVTLSPDALADAVIDRPTILSPKSMLSAAGARGCWPPRKPRSPNRTACWRRCLPIWVLRFPPAICRRNCKRRSRRCSRNRPASIKTSAAVTSSPRSRSPEFFSRRRWRQVESPRAAFPDLKAALIVLRQTLQSALGSNPTAATPAGAQQAAPSQATASLVRVSSPNFDVQEILLPQARLVVAENLALAGQAARNPLAAALDAGPSAGATMNLLQEALQELGNPVRAAATPKDARSGDMTFHTNTPPPPVRGALPAAQPIAQPTILAPHAPLEATAHHLLDDTDAAIARQTLLQVASLPDRIDTSAPKADMNVPRWNFEIPFATPQGTAMAQFEISRDGGSEAVEAAKRVWRARFSLDVEPAGPVHALISLNGDKTSVRLWAERSATAEQLRAGASQLSQALSRAELQPGDIVIRDGAPTQAEPAARAGHFLDRAL